MNEKTKKYIIIVFTAIISLIVSTVAVALGVPMDTLMPQDFLANCSEVVDANEIPCLQDCKNLDVGFETDDATLLQNQASKFSVKLGGKLLFDCKF